MALTLHAEVTVGPSADGVGAEVADTHHPATIAFRRNGGEGEIWVRSPIPAGRGLGFSGAVRVAGLVAAHAQRHGDDAAKLQAAKPELLRLATELEGHADNVAASLYGGVIATAAGRAVRVPMPFDSAVVMWVPSLSTSTDESRSKLPESVPWADAVYNVGRTALLVAALAAGDIDALRAATEDRLHQERRLVRSPTSRAAIASALAAGAWAAWLSGSGPSVAVMCSPAEAATIAASLPVDGHCKSLRIDHIGAEIVTGGVMPQPPGE
ncbi:MAG: homoserine kinase [Actinobacteria bacterium]|nr:homoserine kinase [Actinomycetota bacterium]